MRLQAVDDSLSWGVQNGGFVATTTGPATLTSNLLRLSIDDNDDPPRVNVFLTTSEVAADRSPKTVSVSVAITGDNSFGQEIEVTVTPDTRSDWFTPAKLTISVPAGETRASGAFSMTADTEDMSGDTEIIGFSAAYVPQGSTDATEVSVFQSLTVYDPSVPPTLRHIRQQGQTRRLGGSSQVFLQGDSFGFNIGFTRPFQIQEMSKASLTVTLESGPRTFDCNLQNQRDLVCGYVVRSGDRDTDGVVALESGALQVSWMSTDGETVWDEPTVPTSRQTFDLGTPIYGAPNAVELSVTPGTIQEGQGAVMLTVTASSASGIARNTPIEVPLQFTDVTTSSSDYTADLPQTITIPGGGLEGSTTFAVTAVEDRVEETRVEMVRIDPMGPLVLGKGALLRILDAPTLSLSVTPESITEDGGSQMVTVTAGLAEESDIARPIATPVTLTIAGTAQASEYAVSGTLEVTIPAGARKGSTTLTFTPVDDLLLEGDETIVLNGAATGLSVDSATLTLADDETTPDVVLAVDDNTILESETGGSEVKVTATLDQDAALVDADTVVTLDLAGTATQGTSGDYTAAWTPSNRQITIPARQRSGSSAATLTLTPRQDSVAEGNETIVVQGKAVVQNSDMSGLTVQVVTVTLEDDDTAAVKIEPTTLKFREGGSASYTVALATEPTANVVVGMTTALADTDLTVQPTSLTFTPRNWSQAQTVTVSASADQDFEDDVVTLEHTASGGGYGSVEAHHQRRRRGADRDHPDGGRGYGHNRRPELG